MADATGRSADTFEAPDDADYPHPEELESEPDDNSPHPIEWFERTCRGDGCGVVMPDMGWRVYCDGCRKRGGSA